MSKRLELRGDIAKIERQIDGLMLHREAIDIQLNTSAAILEAKRIELVLIEAESFTQRRQVNFISIEETI